MAISAKLKEVPFSIGDTLAVYQKVVEEKKTRTQIFEGVVIAIKGHKDTKSFTVRKIATGHIGVEKIWPILCPSIEKIEVKKRGQVRRAKLYYLRDRKGRAALKIKEIKEEPQNAKPKPKSKIGKTRRAAGKKTSSK